METAINPRLAHAIAKLDVILQRFTSEVPSASALVTRTEVQSLLDDLRDPMIAACAHCANTADHYLACGACRAPVFPATAPLALPADAPRTAPARS